jgi:pimeloyl-ACP methyl ester carboxylesterase
MIALIAHIERLLLRLNGYRSRKVSTGVGEMHAFDATGEGELPPLVVLHGISASSTQLRPFLTRMRKHTKRVIAIDLPGHGFSADPRDGLTKETLLLGLTETIDQLIQEPFMLFGNSLGGMGAIQFTLACPQRVRALILCSPGGAPMPEEQFQRFVDNFRIRDNQDALAFIDKITSKPIWFRRFAAPMVRALFNRPLLASFLANVNGSDLLTAEDLQRLHLPISLIWGRDEHLMPKENLVFFKKNLPSHATITEPAGVGHCPYLDRPTKLEHLVKEAMEAFV